MPGGGRRGTGRRCYASIGRSGGCDQPSGGVCYNTEPFGSLSMRWKPLLACCFMINLLLSSCAVDQLARTDDGSIGPAAPTRNVAPGPGDGDWQLVDEAMDLRTLDLVAGATRGPVTALRIDPAVYRISVKYDVRNAGTVREWFEALQPIAVINGGYFDTSGRATALVVFDGIRRGVSYEGFGGMVAINERGEFELRSLSQQPFDEGEALQQAMQSAPMLIQPGGEIARIEDADVDRSRRSVIARDRAGRILLIVSRSPTFTLRELAQALHDSDLEIDAALNLDGGRSTGLYLRTDVTSVAIDSFERVPLVLVVEERVR
jgi:uncharacterized protein YigE (DUF2233 family)